MILGALFAMEKKNSLLKNATNSQKLKVESVYQPNTRTTLTKCLGNVMKNISGLQDSMISKVELGVRTVLHINLKNYVGNIRRPTIGTISNEKTPVA